MLAALALAAALNARPEPAAAAARSAPVLLLVALATLGALSAAWTVGPVDDALRWALVLVALAALVIAAAALPGPQSHAVILVAVAAGAALAGLLGAAAHIDRLGLDVCSAWRPAGPLEYPPALALVCAMGLPAALWCASSAGRTASSLGALCGWLLVLTVAVSASRTGVALAALSLVAAAVLLGGARAPRAAALIAAAGGLSALIVGGELGDDSALALVAALIPAAIIVVAVGAGPSRNENEATPTARRALLGVLVLIGIAGVAAATAQERASDCAYAGFGHGRTAIWNAALDTAVDRPLRGFGLESFAAASRAEQARVRDTPVQYAHDLPLEAWVELGLLGVVLVLALYVAVTRAALRATRPTAALLAAPALAFLAANLLDWPWHLAGCGVLWAIAVGGLVGAPRRP